MRFGSILTALLALSFGAGAETAGKCIKRPQEPFEQVKAHFREPDMIYAPFVFWFWDGPLDPAKTAAKAGKMIGQRINPGYAHARHAMVAGPSLAQDEWLSPRWFEAFGAALDKTEAASGYLGFCDEYWWPSGQAARHRHRPDVRPVNSGASRPAMPGSSVRPEKASNSPGTSLYVPGEFDAKTR